MGGAAAGTAVGAVAGGDDVEFVEVVDLEGAESLPVVRRHDFEDVFGRDDSPSFA